MNRSRRRRKPYQTSLTVIAPNPFVLCDPNAERGTLTVNQISAGAKTGSNPAEIVGYMPKRADFEVEFDNDAELLLAEMEFNEDDSE